MECWVNTVSILVHEKVDNRINLKDYGKGTNVSAT